MSFEQQIERLETNCETTEEWEKACRWIGGQLVNFTRNQIAIEKAFGRRYGEEELQKMVEAYAEEEERSEYNNAEQSFLEAYGYTEGDVRLIDKEYAETFIKAGYNVYLLNGDNTKQVSKNVGEVMSFDGVVGILATDMEKILESDRKESEPNRS